MADKTHIPSEFDLEMIMAHIALARYLLSLADNHGLTHGEKHHLIVVSLMELAKAIHLLNPDRLLLRHDSTDPRDINPFRTRF